ncbi:MAG TPA: nitroreductase family deazaflavin-dependent oxidoreductase [Solirubrobacteraceae bacterium]|jgi:deazaflavin-dependent oxidoreductase (nitroreductase family)|nr:nitroreductase family deazaflavin-dependent oxidoreductase [Solirubrobacteraceae bacterium]
MPSNRFYSRLSMRMPDSWLKATGKLNVPVYRLSRGRLMNKVGTGPVLLLTSTGRRSGQRRTAPVLYLQDGERYVVVGSNAGNVRAPAWSYNLKANPEAEIELRGKRWHVRAHVAEGEERVELWRKVNEMYEGFDDYDANTARDIAVFVLDPR